MSRFFETLKEVSRLQLEQGEPSSEKIENPGTAGLEGFPVPTTGEIRNPNQPAEVSQQPEFINAPAAEKNGIVWKSIPVTLDRKVPLIPHTLDNSIVEQYRRLRTKIQQQSATEPIRSLMIASPGPGDGKTVTAINLGLSFAMLSSTRVLVIDGDLRKGTISKWLGLKDMPGLSNVIEGSATLEDAIFQPEGMPLHFMLNGTSKRPSAELLNSPSLAETMQRMKGHFDLIVMDSPPVNLIADAQMLAGSCDGVLLIARAFRTTSKAFQKMLQDLLPFRIVGTVLNGGMRPQRYQGYYNY